VRELRYAELSTTQQRMYKELESTLTARTETGELLIAPSNLAAQVRLMQLSCASVEITKPNPDDVSTWQVKLREPSPKLDVMEEVLDELGILTVGYAGPPVLIAAEFKQLINLAAARLVKLNVPHRLITGDVGEIDRERALDDLKARRIRALLFTNQAGGTGLDMSAANVLINIQRSWSMIAEKQKEDRPHRPGAEQHEKITIIDIVTRNTVEEAVITRLHEKFERLDEITRDRAKLLNLNAHADTAALDAEEQRVLGAFLGAPTEEFS
jgi:SNF2 family DNA or RNA helicase